MKKFVIAMLLLWPLAVVDQATATEKVIEVTNAGITCSGPLPARITKRFVTHAKRACAKRVRCAVSATAAAGPRRLARYACTGYFVEARCGGNTRQYHSDHIKGKLRIRC